MNGPGLHHRAHGVHPGAFVQPTTPDTTDAQDGVLWIDTSSGPPYALKVWDMAAGLWRSVGFGSSGDLAGGCLLFPLGATICNDADGVVHVNTPAGEFTFDGTGITLPGGHRLEQVP